MLLMKGVITEGGLKWNNVLMKGNLTGRSYQNRIREENFPGRRKVFIEQGLNRRSYRKFLTKEGH